jgi:predicted DNA-binding protein
MKTNSRRFSEPVSFVMNKEVKDRMMKVCVETEKKQGEWLREAVEEKLQREQSLALK